jgi:hypothetical protein
VPPSQEVLLATYQQFQAPRAHDRELFRRVLGGLACREYETVTKAISEAFGLTKTSMSRWFIEASMRELRQLQECPLGNTKWLVLVLDGKTFAGD